MNMGGLYSRTTVTFEPQLEQDELYLDSQKVNGIPLERVTRVLDRVRQLSNLDITAKVESQNNFPTGTGIASSASAFAALSLAASKAAGLELDESELSRLARIGSGSASRSIPGGFVEWRAGDDDLTSFAHSIAPPEHWDLVDCIAILSRTHKRIDSEGGHRIAHTSLFQNPRVEDASRRLDICRSAIQKRDFEALAAIVELDTKLMHAVMMTSEPPLMYWKPLTLDIIHEVTTWRDQGMPICYSIDAGPNVHVICSGDISTDIQGKLEQIPGVIEVRAAPPGGPAYIL